MSKKIMHKNVYCKGNLLIFLGLFTIVATSLLHLKIGELPPNMEQCLTTLMVVKTALNYFHQHKAIG